MGWNKKNVTYGKELETFKLFCFYNKAYLCSGIFNIIIMNKKTILLKTTVAVIFFSLVSCVQSSFDDEQVSTSNNLLLSILMEHGIMRWAMD